ncbi:MAG: chromosome segregation protein SMC [Pseudomonadota bacterium]
MRIKQLHINGFKSFPDKTTINFPNGVSGIVGPNGCGKSNVVDAICWVTGEQSVKVLRGKSMEDVIFAGASGRPAVNMAEVSLTFANDSGSAPEQYRDIPEIMVTRRLHRTGESGYFINRRPCRLKDIQSLLAGSGAGTRTYAVIQQGNIGAITEAGPLERRVFIEDAAGITRYKARKKEALSKVEATNQNLLRVMDIISEVDRSMKGLARQAKKAQRYQEYKASLKSLEVALAVWRHDRLAGKIQETDGLLVSLADERISHETRRRSLDAAMEAVRAQVLEADAAIGKKQAEASVFARRITRLEAELMHAKSSSSRLLSDADGMEREQAREAEKLTALVTEKEEHERERDALLERLGQARGSLDAEQKENADLRREYAEKSALLEKEKARLLERTASQARARNVLENAHTNKNEIARKRRRISEEAMAAEKEDSRLAVELERARANLAEIHEEKAGLEKDVNRTEGLLEETRKQLSEKLKEVQAADARKNSARHEYAALKRMADNNEWYRDGVRAVLKAAKADEAARPPFAGSIHGLVADMVQPLPGWEAAVEAALGEALQYVIVSGPEAAAQAVDHLAGAGLGRAGFIPLSWVPKKAEPDHAPGGSGILEQLTVKEGYEDLVRSLLAHVEVAETGPEALARKNGGNRTTVVTRDGQWTLLPLAVVGGRSGAESPGILAQKSRYGELESLLVTLEEELTSLRGGQKDLEIRARELETGLQKLLAARKETGRLEMESQKAVYRLEEEHKQSGRRREIVLLEKDRLLGEEDEAETLVQRHQEMAERLDREVAETLEAVEQASAQAARLARDLDAVSERTADLKSELVGMQARLDSHAQNARRLGEFEDQQKRRIQKLANSSAERRAEAVLAFGKIADLEKSLALDLQKNARLEEELVLARAELDKMRAVLATHEEDQNRIEDSAKNLADRLRNLEMEQARRKMEQENVIQRIAEKFGRPLWALRQDPELTAPETEDQVATLEKERSELLDRIEHLGEVNTAAISEYEAQAERHAFLCRQKDDLLGAIEALNKVIRKINRYTQARFMETFQQVNEKLAEVFPRLFTGGQAELILTDPDKPLETGVTYRIHPPGKKVTRMSLLSGGEKALSAIAFVFAIFLTRPASFCLMDEIDAPLDDANVYRFNELVKLIREKAQIIMITHNKNSMEFADMLFGVTMERKGISKLVSVDLKKGEHEVAAA